MKTNSPLHFLVFLTSLVVLLFLGPNQKLKAQEYSLGIGTDIPYQFSLSFNVPTHHIDLNYRTGILMPPYSNAIVSFVEALDVEKIYLDLINASFQVSWMDSLRGGYKFEKHKKWYLNLEFRLDYLTAADPPRNLVETIINQPIPSNRATNQPKIKLKSSFLSHRNTLELSIRFRQTTPASTTSRVFV